MGKFSTFLLLFIATAQAAAASDLTKALGDAVAVSSARGLSAVEFCPDNTCTRFTLRGRHSQPALHDFALAYLFGIATDPSLASLQSKSGAPPIIGLLGRYRTQCPRSSEKLAARCIAAYLAKQHDIRAAFVRYDEGGRYEVPRPLSEYVNGT